MQWVVFASAPDETTALVWRDIVMQSGVPCELSPGDVASYLGVTTAPVRLMTGRDFVEKATAALRESLVPEIGTPEQDGVSEPR